MEVLYGESKDCKAFKEFVENAESRQALKKFRKSFESHIAKAAVKLHKKILHSENAKVYNLTATHNNKIEKKTNVPDKEPVVLKVRIQDSYRKFFYFYDGFEFGLTKDWTGQFENVDKIHVYEVNKHDYSKA